MKYRVLTPEEMEAYKIGYKVGARELFITGQEWDSEEEHQIYRKGYNAGCKDRQRKNLKPELLDKCQQCQQCQQCPICDSQDSVYPIDTDTVTDTLDNNISISKIDIDSIYTTRACVQEIIEQTANNMKDTGRSIVITPDIVFPNNEFFKAYKSQMPEATNRTQIWIRTSKLLGKRISYHKIGEIIQKFNKNQKNT